MAYEDEYDVVVIGFGLAGASAAIGAAEAGARVLVLDRRRLGMRPTWYSGAHHRRHVRELRMAALTAGVDVRRQCAVHELMVEGDTVVGVGYATLDLPGVPGVSHAVLNGLGSWIAPVWSALGRAVSGAADTVWDRTSDVGTVRCSSVVLGSDPGCWDFVGPAVWAVMCSAGWRLEVPHTGASRRLGVALSGDDPLVTVSPERALREWCAVQAVGRSGGLGELRVERGSGRINLGERGAVPGLYATASSTDEVDAVTSEALAREVGRAAATDRLAPVGSDLRLVV